MKKICLILALCLSLLTATCAAAEFEPLSAIDAIMSAATVQAFTDAPVAKEDLDVILKAGLQTASAQNKQPWHFVVITDHELMLEINADGADFSHLRQPGLAKGLFGDSPAAIVVYNSRESVSVALGFDCGMATQNMVIAATALGYGTKVMGMPGLALNGANHDAWCERLGVPTDMDCTAVILLGRVDVDAVGSATPNADTVSGATTRMTIGEKVSFR